MHDKPVATMWWNGISARILLQRSRTDFEETEDREERLASVVLAVLVVVVIFVGVVVLIFNAPYSVESKLPHGRHVDRLFYKTA